jgi:hypothetical protein
MKIVVHEISILRFIYIGIYNIHPIQVKHVKNESLLICLLQEAVSTIFFLKI